MSGTANNNVYGATSVQQQQEASVLAFTVPPATSGSSFSFSISATGGPTLGTITAPNLTVNGNTVTVPSGFTGTATVTIALTGANVSSASFTITQSSATAQNGTQTSLTVNTFGWFLVTALGTGASFNALSYMVTGLPSNQGIQLFLPTPLFLIFSVTGTPDYSFTVGNTGSVTSGSVSLSVPAGSGLTLSNGNTTVTATSGLTAGMRSFVTITYTPKNGSPTTTQFAIQRLSATGTGAASNIQVGSLGNILVPGLPAGIYVRGNNVSYQTTSPGNYSISFLGIGVTFNTAAVTFNPNDSAFSFNLAPSGTSVTITDSNSSGEAPSTNFILNTNLGSIDPQIANNPDTDPAGPDLKAHGAGSSPGSRDGASGH